MRHYGFASIVACFCIHSALAEDICALTIAVEYPNGATARSALAELRDSTDHVIATAPIMNGQGQFCDLGFDTYSVYIRDPQGGLPVTVHGLRFDGTPRTIQVVLNFTGGGDMLYGSTGCRVYLRVVSLKDGQVLDRAIAKIGRSSYDGDRYGHLVLWIPVKVFTPIQVERDGYQRSELTLSCSDPAEIIKREVYLSSTIR